MEEPTHDDDDEEQDSYPYYMEPPDDDNARDQNTRDPYSYPDNGQYVWSYLWAVTTRGGVSHRDVKLWLNGRIVNE